MTAIAWVLGLGIFVGLAFAFPKKMLKFVIFVVSAGTVVGASIFSYEKYEAYKREQDVSLLKVHIEYSLEKCSSDYPLRLGVLNKGAKTVESTTFEIAGYRAGYSNPLYETGYTGYQSDKIFAPGDGFVTCWRIPDRAYQVSESLIKNNPPETLEWQIQKVRPVFARE